MQLSRRRIQLAAFAFTIPWIALTSSPWAQTLNEQAMLVASDADSTDVFGSSVSISGDTAMVGALTDDHAGGSNAGSAYVFVRNGTSWTEQTKLVASDAAANDLFGESVAISGDTAMVGALTDDHAGGADAGSAYVFVRNGTIWTEQAKLVASDAAATDYFGRSVSISGDTAIVGAGDDDHGGGTDAGSAYVFVRNETSWTEQTKLVASDAADCAFFGTSVSVSGDTAVVGASFDTHDGGLYAGSAYVFVRTGTSWTEQAKLVASDAAGDDHFGHSVSISADTAGVGAFSDDHAGGTGAGSAYVFVRNGTSWTEQAKLVASDAAGSDYFGYSVSISGDTAVAGARQDNTYAGSAYMFVRKGTSWTERAKLVVSDAADNDRFGESVSISGGTAVVGAYLDNHAGGTDAGSAYVYCLTEASGTFRNAGSNPASYAANAPVLGGTFTGTVDLSKTGHGLALLFGFDSPFTFTFPGGQVLLCLDLGGNGEFLQQTAKPGLLAVFSIPVPLDMSLCGFPVCSQAVHFGNVTPFALSNAQDLIVGL